MGRKLAAELTQAQYDYIAEKVTALRIDNELTLEEVASMTTKQNGHPFSRSFIGHVARGDYAPPRELVEQLADIFGVAPSDILGTVDINDLHTARNVNEGWHYSRPSMRKKYGMRREHQTVRHSKFKDKEEVKVSSPNVDQDFRKRLERAKMGTFEPLPGAFWKVSSRSPKSTDIFEKWLRQQLIRNEGIIDTRKLRRAIESEGIPYSKVNNANKRIGARFQTLGRQGKDGHFLVWDRWIAEQAMRERQSDPEPEPQEPPDAPVPVDPPEPSLPPDPDAEPVSEPPDEPGGTEDFIEQVKEALTTETMKGSLSLQLVSYNEIDDVTVALTDGTLIIVAKGLVIQFPVDTIEITTPVGTFNLKEFGFEVQT